ncbi:MAG: cellulose biosynthesis cyclic di-GMP-binding regulatory protein BcsB [Pigmentiphaga sp.]|nr:cellulose biosynthesis cyclic di-GMP-binding regulatory protein BcsB [Pigmentiphaga sp.]
MAKVNWLGQFAILGLAVFGAAAHAQAPAPDGGPGAPAAPAAGVTATAAPAQPVRRPVPRPGERTYDLTFRELGAAYPLALRGVDGRNGVLFSVRADEVVTNARVNLEYSYSPALLPEISQLNVMINEQTIASLPVPTAEAGTLRTATVAIPPHLISEFNRANVQLIGHYTLECEDPMHTSLWAIVNNQSSLQFTVQPLRLENDLSLLPLPFFDRRSFGKLHLPIVFGRNLALPKWEAAGVLASWFGGLADFRGAEFPVRVDSLPERGNAIVMAVRGDRFTGLEVPEVSTPTIQMMDNPNDPYGKVLLLVAPDYDGLMTAARALALGSQVFDGPTANIARLADLAPRVPYDAPRWLSSSGPVTFGELTPYQDLSVRGYTPEAVRIPLRIPPDLFGWREKGIPVDLKYRYTPRPIQDQSSLNVSVGDLFLRAMPLPSATGAASSEAERFLRDKLTDPSEVGHARFHVPLYQLPTNTELRFQYYYEYIKEGWCRTVPLDNVEGTIDPDSMLDISGLKHYIEMPNLGAFANSGFPFTRMADFSETVVVVPNQPDAEVLQAFLELMGYMGNITGYPATQLRVRTGADTSELAGNDLLVLAAGRDQPLLSTWVDRLPFQLSASGNTFELANPPGGLLPNLLRRFADTDQARRIELVIRGSETQALVAGFESPLSAKRSVVVLASTDPSHLRKAVAALADTDTNVTTELQGSFAVIKDEGRAETLVTRYDYSLGELGWWLGTRYHLSRNPLGLVVLSLISIIVLAFIAYLLLRARARRRLERP